MPNRPSGKQLRAQVYRAAVDNYFACGTAKALKDALAVDPALAQERVWDHRYGARERAVGDDWERRLVKTRTRCYDEDNRELSDSRARGERD